MGPHDSHECLPWGFERCHHAKAIRDERISCLLISATECFGILVEALKNIECFGVTLRAFDLLRHYVGYDRPKYAVGNVGRDDDFVAPLIISVEPIPTTCHLRNLLRRPNCH